MLKRHCYTNCLRSQQGFSLVELLIALALNLILMGGVISVLMSNQQSFRTNQAMTEVQDGSRIAFEFLGRDIRDAGLTGCGNAGRVSNVLSNGPNNGGSDWWANWSNVIQGYDDANKDPALSALAGSGPVAGSSSIQIHSVSGNAMSVLAHVGAQNQFELQAGSTAFQTGDIVMVCDPDHATLFQISSYSPATGHLIYNTGKGTWPGNCSKGLGFPTLCTVKGNSYEFGTNAQIGKLNAMDWYIGQNPLGGNSLYRASLVRVPGNQVILSTQEMVRSVTDMQVRYLVEGADHFAKAANLKISDWALVNAVQITLTLSGTTQRAGVNGQNLKRTYTTTIALRNRTN